MYSSVKRRAAQAAVALVLLALTLGLFTTLFPKAAFAQQLVRVASGTITAVTTITNAVTVTDGSGALNTIVDSGSVTADTELAAAAALGDNTANPTISGLAAYLMCYDGSTWDRCTAAAEIADEAAFTYATTKVQPLGAVAESTTDALADGTVGAPVMTLLRMLRSVPSGNNVGGGTPVVMLSDAADNDDETAICTADCTVYSITAFNHAAASAFLRCEADTAGNTTPGSETASAGEFDLEIPGDAAGAGLHLTFPTGVSYTTALTCWLSTGEASSSTTDPGENDVRVLFSRTQ